MKVYVIPSRRCGWRHYSSLYGRPLVPRFVVRQESPRLVAVWDWAIGAAVTCCLRLATARQKARQWNENDLQGRPSRTWRRRTR